MRFNQVTVLLTNAKIHPYCLAPRPSDLGELPENSAAIIEGLSGIAGAQVLAYPCGSLIAVVSVFGKNSEFSQNHVVEHARVVSQFLELAPVLPFRFGTVFEDVASLVRAINTNRRQFDVSLKRLTTPRRPLPKVAKRAEIQYHSCFISYSTQDQAFADVLFKDLKANGVDCWFAPHSVRGGSKLHDQIDEAIRIYDRLLLILSPDSMRSDWVKTEISKARRREIEEERKILFPVRLVDFTALRSWECFDADTGRDSAKEIREYFIPDFSDWKDPKRYSRELQNLFRDLRSSNAKAVRRSNC
jgi:hypothetical protein